MKTNLVNITTHLKGKTCFKFPKSISAVAEHQLKTHINFKIRIFHDESIALAF